MTKVTVAIAIALAVVVLLLADSVEGRMKAYRHIMMMKANADATKVYSNATNHNSTHESPVPFLIFSAVMGSFFLIVLLMQKCSVIMIQVAVKGDPSLRRDLFIISTVANSMKHNHKHQFKRWKFLLSDTASRLLQHLDRCHFANSSVNVIRLVTGSWKKSFNRISHEENKQFDGNNVLSRGARRCNEFVVVTILVAASGTHKLPEINSHIDLEKALVYLKAISAFNIHAVKVFCTPDDGNKKLLEKDLNGHFPLLRLL